MRNAVGMKIGMKMGIGNIPKYFLCKNCGMRWGIREWDLGIREWDLGMGMSDIPKYCVIIRGIWCYLCKNCGMLWGIREWDLGIREWDLGIREWDLGIREWDLGMQEWEYSWENCVKIGNY